MSSADCQVRACRHTGCGTWAAGKSAAMPMVSGPARPWTPCSEGSVGGRQIHDANIVATMLAYGELRLLTFNVADSRR